MSSSASAESILNRQLMERLKKHIFYFKNNASQPKNFFEKSQKSRNFWDQKNSFAKMRQLPNTISGYKKNTPLQFLLNRRYCASDLLCHVNFSLKKFFGNLKKNLWIFGKDFFHYLLTIIPKFLKFFKKNFINFLCGLEYHKIHFCRAKCSPSDFRAGF